MVVEKLAAEARQMVVGTTPGGRKRRPPSSPAPAASAADGALFESLRSLRKELADKQRVPAYIVFSDKVLWEMAGRKPATGEELLELPGVGPAKLERYGKAFLDRMRRFSETDADALGEDL
jgi:ATP-dependent DNA helicase RecQ